MQRCPCAHLISVGCHYRWYTIPEICMILERFAGVVFVGDATLQTIYNGFNILLREDLALGSLNTWEMDATERAGCTCNNQFVREPCGRYYTTSGHDIARHVTPKHVYSHPCLRAKHAFLSVHTSPAADSVVDAFKQLVPPAPRSQYQPIAIIHSLTLANSSPLATASLTEFLALADASKRKTRTLWIGPPAAGHIEIRGRKGNQEVWQFHSDMAQFAQSRDVDVLGMWNMTVQADSWDGLRFGEQVSIVQAMMVINWLSRLESS